MNLVKNIRQFFVLQYKLNPQERDLGLSRIFSFLGILLVPFFTILTWNTHDLFQFTCLVIFMFSFLSTFLGSYFFENIKNNITHILFAHYIAITLFAIFVAYRQQFSIDYSFALTILFFCFSVILTSPRQIVFYYSIVFAAGAIALSASDELQISASFLISFYAIFLLLGYFAARYKAMIQEKLVYNERLYRTLVNNMNEGIIKVDLYERIELVNERYCELVGYSQQELIGKNAPEMLVADAESHKALREAAQLRREGIASDYELRLRKKTGELFWTRMSGAPTYNNEGKVVGSIGIITDITQSKKEKKELQQNEEKYRTIVENAPDAIVVIDVDNEVFVDVNQNAVDFFGYSKKELLELGPDDVSPAFKQDGKTSQGGAKAQMAKALKGENVVFETVHKNKKNEEFPCEVRVVRFPDERRNLVRASISNISERKKAEQDLLESEERFRSLVESIFQGVVISYEGKIVESNETFAKMFGYSRKQIIQMTTKELTTKESAKKIIKYAKEKYEGVYELTGVKKNGEKFELEASAKNTKYKGKNARIIAFRDITERKKAEEALRESEEKYRKLVETIPSGLEHIDTKGKILYASPSLHKIYEYEDGELIGKEVFDMLASDEHRKKFRKKLAKVKKGTSVPKPYTGLNVTKTGKVIDIEVDWNYRRDKEGSVIGFTSVITDISDRKKVEEERLRANVAELAAKKMKKEIQERTKAEKELRQSEERYRDLFENASDMIQSADAKGNILYVNKAWKETLGYLDKDLKNKNIFEMIHPDSLNHSMMAFEKIAKGENINDLEVEFKTKSGRKILARGNVSSKFENGKFISSRGIFRDITERKKAEDQLKSSLREKDVLLQEVHHRVKNNLQVISSILNLQSSYVKDEKTHAVLRESQNRIKSMSFIHESLYQETDFSKIDFSEYIVNLSNNLAHSYGLNGDLVELKLDVDNVLLSLDQAIPCGLIINELVSNALKYAFPVNHLNGKKGNVQVIVKENKKDVKVSIGDNGIGMPNGFDYQNTETLGLQLVMSLVEQLNGKIELKNKNGTEFNIIFQRQNS
ncbi:MAG: hypothetical protein COA57_06895 [Flavobacteriales bacterium]|nr:MAG: hypothetical protein COA57_06895 [Flavobacteriales bacterium]